MPSTYCIPIEDGRTNVPATVRERLNSNRSGGTSCTPAVQRNISPSNNPQWKLDASTKNHNKVSCSSTGVVCDPPPTNHNKVSCSSTSVVPDPPPNNSEFDSPESSHLPPKNIIVKYNSLKTLIEDDIVCKHCSSVSEGKRMADFFLP